MNKQNNVLYIIIGFALLAYVLPWIVTQTSPLTLGAYDLAEWTSLHPSQPYTSPPLIVAFSLRVQLVIITIIIALVVNQRSTQIFSCILIIILAIGQLPPFEFISALDNINYQQQFIFASISLIAGLIFIFWKPSRFIPIIITTLTVIGGILAIVGINEAQNLYRLSFEQPTIGIGVIIFLISYVLIGVVTIRKFD